MARPRKLEPGEPFEDLESFVDWCTDRKPVFWFGSRPVNAQVALNQQLSFVLSSIRGRRIRRAWISREWHDWAMGRRA